jgi:hypothetical protein
MKDATWNRGDFECIAQSIVTHKYEVDKVTCDEEFASVGT